jgi:hypothetical protein
LDRWQDQAREGEAELETDLVCDGAPLVMYRWGTKAERSREKAGVSWSYVLLNPSLRLLIRRSPLGGIEAQARLGSECLWRRTPKAALDELTLLMKRLWHGQKGHWQVSQVHLCHDVANVPLTMEMLSRFVSRSRQRAIYEAAQADVHRIAQARSGGTDDDVDDLMREGIDWAEEFADDDPMSAFSSFSYGDVFADDRGRSWATGMQEEAPQEDVPAEERACSVYQYGKRMSGVTFSPGGAISVAIYLKRFESSLRRKVHMFPLWKAAGWNEEDEVTRVEARMRRDSLRDLRVPGVEHASLDDPYEMLKNLQGIFRLVVGGADECPDAVNTAWLRLVQPREAETNRSRWDTDPTWRIVQAASFTAVPVAARRIIRRKQRAQMVQHLTAGSYGYLVSLITEQFPEGERWDVSRGIRELAEHLTREAGKPGKDFGELVRQRRKARGLSVLPRDTTLPDPPRASLSITQRILSPPVAEAGERKPVGAPWQLEREELRPLLRKLCAEGRMRDALLALDDAERRQEGEQRLAWHEAHYRQELATYAAICGQSPGSVGEVQYGEHTKPDE